MLSSLKASSIEIMLLCQVSMTWSKVKISAINSLSAISNCSFDTQNPQSEWYNRPCYVTWLWSDLKNLQLQFNPVFQLNKALSSPTLACRLVLHLVCNTPQIATNLYIHFQEMCETSTLVNCKRNVWCWIGCQKITTFQPLMNSFIMRPGFLSNPRGLP
jgi:hypothetical protein